MTSNFVTLRAMPCLYAACSSAGLNHTKHHDPACVPRLCAVCSLQQAVLGLHMAC